MVCDTHFSPMKRSMEDFPSNSCPSTLSVRRRAALSHTCTHTHTHTHTHSSPPCFPPSLFCLNGFPHILTVWSSEAVKRTDLERERGREREGKREGRREGGREEGRKGRQEGRERENERVGQDNGGELARPTPLLQVLQTHDGGRVGTRV